MSIKINKLEIENVKRVKAIRIQPDENGLTIIGGDNNQGKTSVLDSIAWVLGGNKYRPSDAHRKDSTIPPSLKLVLNNGLVVERKGKNSDLKVVDPEGQKAGQQLLDSFVEELALNLPKFMESTSKEKANTLLQIIGVGDKLLELEKAEQDTYNQRRAIGQIADQKKKYAEEQVYYPDAPKEPISAADLIKQQQEILATNGENQRKRQNLKQYVDQYNTLETQMEELKLKLEETAANLRVAQMEAKDLQDESTSELEESISNVEEINRKVRANLDKEKAEDDAKEYEEQYKTLSLKIDGIRNVKTALLKNADLPLDGLTVEDGDLLYNGFKWDGMSGSDQLKVATAIVRKLNPNCGFVLLDKLEQMDMKTLKEFGTWLELEGLQAIATRVSTGEECQIIIEDGYSVDKVAPQKTEVQNTKWEAGKF